MTCHAFCTAASYDLKQLHATLREEYCTATIHDVLHIEYPSDPLGHIFYFPYGAVIFWDIREDIQNKFLKQLHDFQENPVEYIETDEFIVSVGDKPQIHEHDIILPDQEMLTKLAISHGVAQSVKLGTFESTLADTFDKTKHIPETLSKQGKISLSRVEIRRKMGELFIERSSINLQVDLLNTPEFFWEYPELDKLYEITSNELEIASRGQLLNHRLDVIKELFEMLGNELNHQHSNRLEWIIIWLIVMEVILSLLTIFKFV